MNREFRQLNTIIRRLEQGTERELAIAYTNALRDIKRTLTGYFERYSVGGRLTYEDMLNYKRLQRLEREVIEVLQDMTGFAARQTRALAREALQEAYYRSVYAIEGAANVRIMYGKLDREAIEQAIQMPISGLTLNELLEGRRGEIIRTVRQSITQELIKGSSYRQMAERLNRTFNGDYNKAIRVVRTETHRVQNYARNQALIEAEGKGIKMRKIWVATLNGRTRDTHQELDGQAADEEGYFHYQGMRTQYPGGFGDAAMDINCRCTVRGEIIGYEPQVRIARENRFEKGELISHMTYEEWRQNRNIS